MAGDNPATAAAALPVVGLDDAAAAVAFALPSAGDGTPLETITARVAPSALDAVDAAGLFLAFNEDV